MKKKLKKDLFVKRSVRLTRELDEYIKTLASKAGVTESVVIRTLLYDKKIKKAA